MARLRAVSSSMSIFTSPDFSSVIDKSFSRVPSIDEKWSRVVIFGVKVNVGTLPT